MKTICFNKRQRVIFILLKKVCLNNLQRRIKFIVSIQAMQRIKVDSHVGWMRTFLPLFIWCRVEYLRNIHNSNKKMESKFEIDVDATATGTHNEVQTGLIWASVQTSATV